MIKYKKINPSLNETYEVGFDDKCLVVKSGKNKVWISKAMAMWIALNFANKIDVEFKLTKKE